MHDHRRTWASRTNLALMAFIAIAGFYLLAEHRAHVFGILPWLLLLACPLVHLFMHGGHGGQGSDEPGSPGDSPSAPRRP